MTFLLSTPGWLLFSYCGLSPAQSRWNWQMGVALFAIAVRPGKLLLPVPARGQGRISAFTRGCDPRNFPFRPVAACGWSVHPSLDEDWSGNCNTLTVFTEHLQFWQVGMTWDASMIGCYSFSVDDASCSDCLSFFGQSWSSMTPLRSLSWRRVNRLSTHLKCLFFIWFYLEIVYGIL